MTSTALRGSSHAVIKETQLVEVAQSKIDRPTIDASWAVGTSLRPRLLGQSYSPLPQGQQSKLEFDNKAELESTIGVMYVFTKHICIPRYAVKNARVCIWKKRYKYPGVLLVSL